MRSDHPAAIRPATPADLPRLVAMGRAFFDEAQWSDVLRWDDAGAAESLACMVDADNSVMLVAEAGGHVVGMAAAALCPAWFNPAEMTAQEWYWYVEPEHRTGHGQALLDALEQAVRTKGARTFTMLAVAALRGPALDRLYRRRGYRASELTFVKRL